MADAWYRKNSGSVFSLEYHFVFCPKYRRPVLVGEVDERLSELSRGTAAEIDAAVEALEVMPDHVHMFISSDPTEAPQRLANQGKCYTSRILREEFARLKSRLPSLWSRSHFISSAGRVSAQTVKHYIETQKGV